MRLVQVLVPDGKLSAVEQTLSEADIEYSVIEETSQSEYIAVVTFPLPTAAVEPILESLRGAGIDESTSTVILDAETVISSKFEELEEEYASEADEESESITGQDRISREELQTRAKDLVAATRTYIVLTIVSAVIATAGLILDSPATVVGSMVIAPLIGPSMAASVGTVMGDRELFGTAIRMQLLGIGVAILSATAFAFAIRYLNLVPPGIDILALAEVSERAAPNFLVLAIAVGAGIAGILSLMTGVSAALVGVMIAVALIPPAAAVGVGVAFAIPRLALGAGVLVIVNVLSINLASLVTLWFEGYQPESWFKTRTVRGTLFKQVGVLVVAIALVSAFPLAVTYDTYVAANTEQDIRTAVDGELQDVEEPLELRDLQVERGGIIPPLETEAVTVRVSIEPGHSIPPLVDRLGERIEAITGSPVDVSVEFVFVQQES